MNGKSKEEIRELKRLNKALLRDIGYENSIIVNEEADEILEKYKDIEVPKSLDDWFAEHLKKEMKKERRLKTKAYILRTSRLTAAVLLVMLVFLSVVTFSVEAFRMNFFDMTFEARKKFGIISYEERLRNENELIPEGWKGYYPTYLPEGFEINDYQESVDLSMIEYVDDADGRVMFVQGTIDLDTQLDIEDAKVISVEVHGIQGILSEKEGYVTVVWSEGETSFVLSGTLDKNEMIRIGDSIKK